MTKALLTCLSHTPLKGNVDPLPEVVDEVAPMWPPISPRPTA